MTERPVRVVLVPGSARPARPSLAEYVAANPTYGTRLGARRAPDGTGVSDAVLAGVFASGSLLGLFQLIRAWIDLQRGRTTVKVVVGQGIEIVIDSRSDPTALLAEVMRATAHGPS